MSAPVAYALALALALAAGWVIPALAMRALAPSLAASTLAVSNYRGRRVFLGLGAVWVVWAVSLLAADALVAAAGMFAGGAYGTFEMLFFDGPLTMALSAVPLMLTVSASFFGLVDDAFGTGDDKGFRGHLRALRGGRLSTGGLKLFGIGVVAAVYGWSAAIAGEAEHAGGASWTLVAWWVAATATIALSANLLNLLDLRPGRALKSYAVLGTVAGVLFGLAAVRQYLEFWGEAGVTWTVADTVVSTACLIVVLLGPVAAVWRLDLGERGMLGDAGSNAAGAVVGYLLAGALPLPWLAAVAVVLLALNLLSERLSFSRIIDNAPPLAWLDGVGRLPDDEGTDATSGAH